MKRSRLLPALAGCLLLILLAGNQGVPLGQGFDPKALIKPGADFDPQPLVPAGTPIFEGTGFDGQFFFYLAQDPLARGAETRRRMDATRYRVRRILLPATAYAATGGGDRELLPWAIPLINLLAVAGATFLLAGYLRDRGRSPWAALAYPASFGIVAGVISDVADPLAASLLVSGALLWSREKTGVALVALVGAVLARETYLLPALVIVAAELLRFRWRAVSWLAVPGAFAAVMLYASTVPEDTGAEEVPERPALAPFLGAVRKLGLLDNRDVPGVATWEAVGILTMLAVTVYFGVRAGALVLEARRTRVWPSRERLLVVVAAASMILVPFLTAALWGNPLSYHRYAGAAPAFLLVCTIGGGRTPRWLLAALLIVSAFNPYASPVPTTAGPVVTGPGVGPVE